MFHDATIILDEEGTEAAAATAVVMIKQSAPPPGEPLTFDRPFVFYIRDIPTNATLFVGQFVTPD
jgi:serpin B